jgi:hypothetical protein
MTGHSRFVGSSASSPPRTSIATGRWWVHNSQMRTKLNQASANAIAFERRRTFASDTLGAAVLLLVLYGCADNKASSAPVSTLRTTNPVESPCDHLVQKYIGQGLTAGLPPASTIAGGEGTADPGPIPTSAFININIGSASMSVGRIVDKSLTGNTAAPSPEPNTSTRQVGEVTLYVRFPSTEIRECVLSSLSYDETADRADGE